MSQCEIRCIEEMVDGGFQDHGWIVDCMVVRFNIQMVDLNTFTSEG